MTGSRTMFARGGYIPATPVPWFTPRESPWAPLHPDEKVMQADGAVLDAWEYHLLGSLGAGCDERGRR